ncbi:MAG: response regulator [Treponema sp.]|jgi:two-component system response regulator YesN|nr:response regulator [Treponema sp.]
MYKVFLVEDEIVVREGIRNSIPWDKTPYSLAGEAPDGEMALSMIQDIKPDILITDIRMPFMDGLALSRIVKKTLPWIKIIILSGHDEFEYAREAISVGVEEYLLKPVSARDMIATLDRITKRIDEEKERLLNIEKLKAQARSSADILRDKWLSDFMKGRIPAVDAIEKGREFGVDLLARSYIVLVAGIVSPAEKEEQLISVKIILLAIMEKYANSVWFSENDKQFVIILKEMPNNVTGGDSRAATEELAYAIAQAFKYEAERNTGCRVMVGIGPVTERIGEIAKSCSVARKIVNYGIGKGLAQIADSSLLPKEGDDFDPSPLLNIDGDMFLTKLKYAAKKDIDSIIQEYTKGLGSNFSENQMLGYFVLGEIIVAASKIVEAMGGDIRKIAPFSLNQEDIQHIVNSRGLFFEKVKALLSAVIEYRDAHTKGRYQSVIVKAREYIDRNFTAADISLYSTASHVGISPNHLSTVFAQETGENFIEYLTRVRMEKAKQLLQDTAMKSADIAYETGFSDPHYFSYIFKKNTGLSPREFRLSRQ